MSEKRPLVWLSAAPGNSKLRRALEARWQVTGYCLQDRVPIMMSAPEDARVGILDLTNAPTESALNPEQWLEALSLDFWVGIVAHRPVSGSLTAKLIARYCTDFHTVPVHVDRLNTVLGHLWGMASIRTHSLGPPADDYESLVMEGDSETIRKIRGLLRRFSVTADPVLITGESGSGKYAAARFIHQLSPRAAGPLVNVNCAALPDTLARSELFGVEDYSAQGAADGIHPGRIEQANGGSLVLSSIDELNEDQQSALLGFLQEGQIERVGSTTPIPINSRIITTATRPLRELVESGHFRSDVYYRLGGLEIRMPALRDRREDIPTIASTLLEMADHGHNPKRLSQAAIESLVNHHWPGNFRELQNRLRQALLLCDRATIDPADLGLDQTGVDAAPLSTTNLSLEEFRARADRQALSCSLALAHHNVSAAARILKISRVSFYRLMEKYNQNQYPES
ncbi:sigma-54-dependent Fis family transcriptional regulator [Marinobacter salinisoli]|uniref:Sigma-54-dependent Fis family transcriptional regulator n=1 Tax=Marinobacter salinisoli TaxID=2769486 RepID=A0ABX7MS90_9GAMM|nr:sigma-54 dependent transcriptional regulator [Marinobacter salinisoli]QSP95173.1 sigma-54-dependent Fis family transcriptional regulator [Marinobacter salinisoli]